jgi:hypothetical protein
MIGDRSRRRMSGKRLPQFLKLNSFTPFYYCVSLCLYIRMSAWGMRRCGLAEPGQTLAITVNQWANSSTVIIRSIASEFRRIVRNCCRKVSEAAISRSSCFSSSLITVESPP